MTKWLDWLDSKKGWQFVGIIYIVRWCLIVPYMIASKFLFTEAQISQASMSQLRDVNPIILFLALVIISPLLETLLECSLPFFIISVINRKKGKLPPRPWSFIIISALLMVLLHPILAALCRHLLQVFSWPIVTHISPTVISVRPSCIPQHFTRQLM